MISGTGGLAFLAGTLSVLSPCVLPLLPIVLGAATAEHRYAPAALAAGVALAFVTIGLFLATVGYGLGLGADSLRSVAAAIMVAVGTVLAIPPLQVRLAAAGGPVGGWADRNLSGFSRAGLKGQFGVGLLLGAVWSPCVGPTLGAASVLAAQGKDLAHVAIVMTLFGIGAALPLLALGSLSRPALLRWRERLARGGAATKALLGGVLVIVGLLVLTGFDRKLETMLLAAWPQWAVELTTRF